ncbi:AraC family transcriptional regulator [Chryseobacterium lactis]|uniref:AraC family transcriptional regulator n=1 Tax=Chryseobacterium lactis TaxID=1241981 RepID=A0A3G6RW72_CHRLC|nr:AraC family transcriptional regulator [Chryseobacterium lactis]AZA80788.1 AraC family transcriptional regulator [Chryseobacterium lactis]AZB05790.1 AraC family transcriptional regulator [Chryseobacterium lactis]PNW13491.1 AraC family transcriptional regulator [Chryseobacterium lactis]
MENQEVERVNSITEYNKMTNHETLHPLVSVVDFSKSPRICSYRRTYGFYTVFLKDVVCGDMYYGKHSYDYQEGTLVFIAPGQVSGVKNDGAPIQPGGYALLFHPDLIKGTNLGKNMKDYSFFSYDVHEALHLSEKEREIILECFKNIRLELEQPIDKHSKSLVVNNIELFLNYCMRFYDRQFITRDHINQGVIGKFENLVDEYLKSESPKNIGFPMVNYFADKLNLSANYFGDLIKKELGISPQELIHNKLIDVAKEQILEQGKSISEISYDLGFKYPQHFTRLFKTKVGVSPSEYKILN